MPTTQHSAMPAADVLLQNRYQIVRQIGQGGMGTVFEAIDTRLGNVVAIKRTFASALEPTAGESDPLQRAFEREARILASLRHPALPVVSDFFSEQDNRYLVMQFIPGEDCWNLLQQRGQPFSVEEVLGWADTLLDVLDHLHTHQPTILHRDIKPQNLKLTPRGEIILLDFGLARGTITQHSLMTSGGSLVAYTPQYAPMEQIRGLQIDARSDLYALAATLYHLLTGRLPASAIDRAAAAMESRPDPLRPAHLLATHIPIEVSDILMRTMAPRVEDRPANAAALRAILRRAHRTSRHMITTPGTKAKHLIPAQSTSSTPPVQKERTARKPWRMQQYITRFQQHTWPRIVSQSLHLHQRVLAWMHTQRVAIGNIKLQIPLKPQALLQSAQAQMLGVRPWMQALRVAAPGWMQRREAITSTLVALIFAIGLTFALPRDSSAHPSEAPNPIVAAKLFEARTTQVPAHTDPSIDRGYHRAIDTLTAAISVHPNDPRNYLSRAEAYVALDEYTPALADYTRSLALRQDDPAAFIGRAEVYLRQRNPSSAVADYTRALALHPDDAAIYRGRGQAYLQARSYHEALSDFDQAIRRQPDHPSGYVQRGLAHMGLGEYEGAIADSTHALELEPKLADAFLNRGRVAFYQRSYERAISDYTSFLELNPGSAVGLYHRGLAYSALGNQAQAISDFSAYITQHPDDADVYLYRALAQSRLGQRSSAQADLETCLRLATDSTLRTQAEQQLKLLING